MRALIVAAIAVACATSAYAADGAELYSKHCEACHGKEAKGANALALVPYDHELSELVTIVRQGVGMMPSFSRDQITDADIEQIHNYLKELKPHRAAAHADSLSRAAVQNHRRAVYPDEPRRREAPSGPRCSCVSNRTEYAAATRR